MQVILSEAIEKLGQPGEVVDVSRGYARNYLIPRGLAVLADTKKVRRMDHQKKVLEDKQKRQLKEVDSLAARLEELSCSIPVQVGEEDKIFGSVTTGDIAESLKAQGIDIDRRKIHIDEPIKALGVYTVQVKVGPERAAHLKVWVVKKTD